MTVVDDLTLLASLLPPPLKAKYQVQPVWAADANKEIGFRFSLCEDFNNRNKKEYRDLQLRDFNLANSIQSRAATARLFNAEEGVFNPKSQEAKPGGDNLEIEDPEVMIGNGDL